MPNFDVVLFVCCVRQNSGYCLSLV